MMLTDANTEQCLTYVTSKRKERCKTDSQIQPAVWTEDKIICQQVSFSVACSMLPGVLYFCLTYYKLRILQPFKDNDQY